MRKRKKKEKREAFTRQEWEKEFGEPLFSAVMQKKWREIFWSFLYVQSDNAKIHLINLGLIFVLSVVVIVMLFNVDNIVLSTAGTLIGVIGLLYFFRSVCVIALAAWISQFISKIKKKIELVFYAESCCVYLEDKQIAYRLYSDLDKIYILPADIWLVFEDRSTLLLPEHSITREQQKIIVEYLKKKKPDVKIEKRKYF